MREIKHLSVHQWLRPAIPDSQQPTSPIGFLFLKLPPPPCAVLLVKECKTIGLTPTRQDFEKHGWTITRDSDLLFFPLFCPLVFSLFRMFFLVFPILSYFPNFLDMFAHFQFSSLAKFRNSCLSASIFPDFFLLCSYIFLFSFGKREKMANQIKKIRRKLPKDEKLIAGFAIIHLFLQSFASFLLFFTFLFLPNAINSYTFPVFLFCSFCFAIFHVSKKIGKHIRT